LADYLRRCECVIDFVGEREIHAWPPPRSRDAEQARLELLAYLRVWKAMHPNAEVTVEDGRPGERLSIA
jgi:hypothetical protein